MPSHSSEGEFGDVLKYPYNVVASPSCHDVLPIRAWWEEDSQRAERLWQRDLKHTVSSVESPPSDCQPFVAEALLSQHLNSPACLMIAPIQDYLALSPKYNKRP